VKSSEEGEKREERRNRTKGVSQGWSQVKRYASDYKKARVHGNIVCIVQTHHHTYTFTLAIPALRRTRTKLHLAVSVVATPHFYATPHYTTALPQYTALHRTMQYATLHRTELH
jgi:hypothetical protein